MDENKGSPLAEVVSTILIFCVLSYMKATFVENGTARRRLRDMNLHVRHARNHAMPSENREPISQAEIVLFARLLRQDATRASFARLFNVGWIPMKFFLSFRIVIKFFLLLRNVILGNVTVNNLLGESRDWEGISKLFIFFAAIQFLYLVEELHYAVFIMASTDSRRAYRISLALRKLGFFIVVVFIVVVHACNWSLEKLRSLTPNLGNMVISAIHWIRDKIVEMHDTTIGSDPYIFKAFMTYTSAVWLSVVDVTLNPSTDRRLESNLFKISFFSFVQTTITLFILLVLNHCQRAKILSKDFLIMEQGLLIFHMTLMLLNSLAGFLSFFIYGFNLHFQAFASLLFTLGLALEYTRCRACVKRAEQAHRAYIMAALQEQLDNPPPPITPPPTNDHDDAPPPSYEEVMRQYTRQTPLEQSYSDAETAEYTDDLSLNRSENERHNETSGDTEPVTLTDINNDTDIVTPDANTENLNKSE